VYLDRMRAVVSFITADSHNSCSYTRE
jgi:hypothetical protein